MNIEILMDEREIQRTLYRLASAMDRRDWASLDTVFTPDATGDFGDGWKLRGREEIVAMFRRFLGSAGPTQHLLGNVVVDVDGNRAESRCYIRDMHQGLGERAHLTLSTPGQYHDRWQRTFEGWRIVHRTKTNFMMLGSIEALGVDNHGQPVR